MWFPPILKNFDEAIFSKYLKSYATIMLQNEKWKFAMEQYYTNRNEPIPWKSQSYEVKFSVPAN